LTTDRKMSEPQLVSSGDSTDDENQRIQLHQQVEELRGFNEALLAENEMFEQFIIHSDKQNQKFSVDPQRNDKLKKGSSIRSISQSRELTIEQKLYVSETAIKEAQKDLEQLRERNMKTWDHYVSTLEEAKLCLEEIRKGKKEFEQKLLRRANEKRLEMKEPEKLLLYIVDNITKRTNIRSKYENLFYFI
uniref:Uncharacterized protein n=1 Tax=Takifugu rubripes TaxID=31033 RepID=H2TC34_TAKRU